MSDTFATVTPLMGTLCAVGHSQIAFADRDLVDKSSVSVGPLVSEGSKGLRVFNEWLIVIHKLQGVGSMPRVVGACAYWSLWPSSIS